MYTINFSFKIEHEIFDDFQEWLQNDFISETIKENHFSGFHLFKLLGHDDEHGKTLVLQLIVSSRAILNSFIENRESALKNHIVEKWGDHVMFFQSVLERVD